MIPAFSNLNAKESDASSGLSGRTVVFGSDVPAIGNALAMNPLFSTSSLSVSSLVRFAYAVPFS